MNTPKEGSASSASVYVRDWRKRHPMVDRTEGMYLWDTDGKRYLDGVGGVHVVNIGHGVKEVIDAIEKAGRKLDFPYSGTFLNEYQVALANKILELAPDGMAKVYFVCGGSEANEIAMAAAYHYFVEKGKPTKHRVVSRWQSYHGSTVGAMSMTGHITRRRDHQPYLLNFPHIPSCNCYRCYAGKTYPECNLACAWELDSTIRREGPASIAAFIAEPIVGTTAACLTPPPGYYETIRGICDAHDVLFVADEVITGFGRTGRNFGVNHWEATPDIITCAKGLASGYLPIGGVMLHQRIWEAFEKGSRSGFFIGYTFGANPMACAAGTAVQEYIQQHELIERSARMGDYLKAELQAMANRTGIVGDVRGKGLLLGLEFVKDPATKEPFERSKRVFEQVVATAFKKGLLLIGGAGTADGERGDHVLVTPPFVITEAQCRECVDLLEESIYEVKREVLI